MSVQRYVIDTSSLLNSWLYRFPIDVAPGVWANLDALIADGRAVAPTDVLDELARKDDDVHRWVRARRENLVVGLENVDVAALKTIVNDERFNGLVKNRPDRNRADPVVIAVAQARGCVVVTEENDDGSAKHCRIPYVCNMLDVPWLNFVGLMRAEGWRLQ